MSRVPRTPPRSPISGKTNLDAKDLPKLPEGVQRTISSLPIQEDDTPSSSENTIRRDEYHKIKKLLGPVSPGSVGSNTLVPNRTPYAGTSGSATLCYDDRSISSTVSSAGHSANHSDVEDSDSESGGGTMWAKPPPRAANPARPVLPPIDTDSSPSSHSTPLPRQPPANMPPLPDYIPEPPPQRRAAGRTSGRNLKDQRTSRFDNNFDITWAPRPPPEEVLERLQEYFPEHDVDEPVIEAPSGGTSPTSTSPDPLPVAEKRFRHKKSIRVVAAERRRIDGNTHVAPAANAPGATLRKRNTKLWGSRLEEVPTHEQANKQKALSAASDGSPGTVKRMSFPLL